MRTSKEGEGLRAVLFNPPVGDGARTVARVRLAGEILGHDTIRITNLFPLPTASVLDVNGIRADAEVWKAARTSISQTLDGASDILLAYGCQEPVGPVRQHFRAQLVWLHQELDATTSRIWSVSSLPRHPSRWQRHTARHFPGVPFVEALAGSLQRVYLNRE